MSTWRTPEELYSRREFCLAVLIACIWGLILIAVVVVFMLLVGGDDRRIEKARRQGREEAEREILAAGGRTAWVNAQVDRYNSMAR